MDVPPVSISSRSSALRLRTSISNAFLMIVCFVFGPVSSVGIALDGDYVYALIGVVFVLYGIYSLGSVTVVDGTIERRALFRNATVPGHDVREIGLGARRAGTTKYWMPVIETVDGDAIVLNNLMSVSKKRSQDRVNTIREAAKRGPAKPADTFAGTNFASKDAEPEPEPAPLLSGYQQYLQEQAAGGGTSAPAPTAATSTLSPEPLAPVVSIQAPPPMLRVGSTSRAA